MYLAPLICSGRVFIHKTTKMDVHACPIEGGHYTCMLRKDGTFSIRDVLQFKSIREAAAEIQRRFKVKRAKVKDGKPTKELWYELYDHQ